jgi:hypothetical protein
MGSFERFTTKTHFNSLKRLVLLAAPVALAVTLPRREAATATAPSGSWSTRSSG